VGRGDLDHRLIEPATLVSSYLIFAKAAPARLQLPKQRLDIGWPRRLG
jgi:hypothetical protein